MKRHTELFLFPLIVILALAGYFAEKTIGVFLDEIFKTKLEAALGVSLGDFLTRLSSATLSAITLGITLYVMYRYIVRDIAAAAEKKESEQLTVTFDPNDPVCVKDNVPARLTDTRSGIPTTRQYMTKFYRMKISVGGDGDADGCQAFITSIKHNGVDIVGGEILSLPFSNMTATSTKRILNGVPDSVDFLYITHSDDVILSTLSTPGSISFGTLFSETGDYEFTMIAAAPGKTGKTLRVVFHWTGSYQTAHVFAA